MAINYKDIARDLTAYVLGESDVVPDTYSDDEIAACAKKAAYELLNYKRHLLIDEGGNPRKSSEVVGEAAADLPDKYRGALMHGALMFLFTEDQQRSSFERGLFMQQAGIGR